MTNNIKNILERLPQTPGIYKMIDEEGRVIYVGKANNLKKRVNQYFKNGYEHSTRTRKLVENIFNIETISVDNELEAIILEHNLIKQLQPKYNVIMKDDKNYVYIKITKEDYPRIQIVRKLEKDNAKYIGPKTAAHKVKDTFKILKKLFPFRHCGLDIEFIKPSDQGKNEVNIKNKVLKYPCIDHYIKRCSAPCIGLISPEEYQKIIKYVEDFFEGKSDDIIPKLYEEMQKLAAEKQFEKAAKLRDKIKKVEDIMQIQKVQDIHQEDKDIINYCITQNRAYISLFQIRNGKLIDQQNFILSAQDIEESESNEVLEAFIRQYYEISTDIPRQILIPHEPENKKELEIFLEKQKEKKVNLIIPIRGTKNKLLEMCLNNARIFADRNKPKWQEESELTIKATEELQKVLKIKNQIKRIECYDISHLSGTDTVGSMIVFGNGAPKKDMYRKFQIRSVIGKPDDFKCMEEVLTRRFSKINHELKQKDFKIRKACLSGRQANKKDKKFIEIDQTDKNFYILEKNKEQIGYIALKDHTNKISELSDLYLKDEYKNENLGYKLIREVAKKAKGNRIYLFSTAENKDFYLLTGFEEIKKIPDELKNENNLIPLAMDKIKLKEDKSFTQIPDLVIIDGGKGQLGIATQVFKKFNLDIKYIALAKRLEEIFLPEKPEPIILPSHHEALKLLQRARDEAHRFAISYNKNLRSKNFKK